jgi:GLPGLI family protein
MSIFGFISKDGYGNEKYFTHVSYEMILNFGSADELNGLLSFNNTSALYRYSRAEKDEYDEEAAQYSDQMSIALIDTTSVELYTEKTSNTMSEIVFDPIKKHRYLIQDQLDTIQWLITDEVKLIGDFQCNKAMCYYKGRNYTVWFTFSIPCSFGPWKLHGLPGLIIHASDDRQEVIFSAKKIATYSMEYVWNGSVYQQLTRAEYQQMLNDHSIEMMKRITSKSPQRFNVNISTPKQYGIELEEKQP